MNAMKITEVWKTITPKGAERYWRYSCPPAAHCPSSEQKPNSAS